jgi:hypothetical protein
LVPNDAALKEPSPPQHNNAADGNGDSDNSGGQFLHCSKRCFFYGDMILVKLLFCFVNRFQEKPAILDEMDNPIDSAE